MTAQSFEKFVKEEGPKIIEKVREDQLRASSSEAATENADRSHEAAHEIELRDELQIAEEMQGRLLDEYFYSFTMRGGGEVTGLSWAGTKAVARTMAAGGEPLSIADLKVNDDEDHFTALAKAENLKTREVRWGIATQTKVLKTKKGDVPDEFALQKAVNKSQRNALRQHIPEVVIVEMFREWKKGKGRS